MAEAITRIQMRNMQAVTRLSFPCPLRAWIWG